MVLLNQSKLIMRVWSNASAQTWGVVNVSKSYWRVLRVRAEGYKGSVGATGNLGLRVSKIRVAFLGVAIKLIISKPGCYLGRPAYGKRK